ncbi:hypothetical protein CS0771_54260 [Catellatospora sp. IY07-71]|nr:hypothetical protein CS0771_54260 [Catellatospora sp. IY07-71]
MWHTHGSEPVDSVTHRAAHCYAPDCGHRENGGYLVEVSRLPFSGQEADEGTAATPVQRVDVQAGRIRDVVGRLRSQSQPSGLEPPSKLRTRAMGLVLARVSPAGSCH